MSSTLVAMVDASMRIHPDRVAVVDVDGGSTTHAQLDRMADGYAAALLAAGVRRGDRVGVCRRKSAGTVAGLLAIMRIGAAHVPVDPSSPPQRNRTIFKDCGVTAILVDDEGSSGVSG